jgi:hypothetical protein
LKRRYTLRETTEKPSHVAHTSTYKLKRHNQKIKKNPKKFEVPIGVNKNRKDTYHRALEKAVNDTSTNKFVVYPDALQMLEKWMGMSADAAGVGNEGENDDEDEDVDMAPPAMPTPSKDPPKRKARFSEQRKKGNRNQDYFGKEGMQLLDLYFVTFLIGC